MYLDLAIRLESEHVSEKERMGSVVPDIVSDAKREGSAYQRGISGRTALKDPVSDGTTVRENTGERAAIKTRAR